MTPFGKSLPRSCSRSGRTFATPVWLNVGLSERPLASACFILHAGDSIPELLDWNTREGLIFQQGGGAGINLSRIRSSREPV
jgi:ribonucleoside-diphosphate reductase alpha chain